MKIAKALRTLSTNSVVSLKHVFYHGRGEPITYGSHRLRFLPGTRPVRLKYIDSPNGTVRNDAKQVKFFLEHIKRGDFILDIGGNVGQYAVLFASLAAESGQVITFEPDESSRDILKRNLSLNGVQDRVRVEDIALFDTVGTRTLFSSCRGDANASLIGPVVCERSTKSVRQQLVKTERLDYYLISRNLSCPDWIKMDTEGAEINILRSAKEILKSGAKIACELHPYAWPQFGTTFQELLDTISDCGRNLRYLDETHNIRDGAVYGVALIL